MPLATKFLLLIKIHHYPTPTLTANPNFTSTATPFSTLMSNLRQRRRRLRQQQQLQQQQQQQQRPPVKGGACSGISASKNFERRCGLDNE